ncbi:ATP-binding region ATPase domain protein [Streptomyces violaceusniger Tu 4113]|uniref:ATP-binding region ATPase domain protein n=1 Tax=Streptomyces violaceusniger (strain Tu 4113) TaxID=653045 RepID=G2PB12_STRV4|nr:ATP-binding region ATPase domain protein [Streptomyces violaceusniger Tu 4113]
MVRRWTRHPRCVALARADLRKALAGWGLIAVEEVALLVLSELITNAVRHARVPGRQIETRYLHQGDKVRLEVHDAADQLPKLRTPTPESVRGRGLVLVESLADHWGVTPRAAVGKAVWAVLTLPVDERASLAGEERREGHS